MEIQVVPLIIVIGYMIAMLVVGAIVSKLQIKNAKGYDHNWVLNRSGDGVEFAASVYDPEFGRYLEVFTDQIGLQFYAGNFFDGTTTGKTGKPFNHRATVVLETQKFPDSCNQPSFPSIRLNPGETYTQTCIYKFSAK